MEDSFHSPGECRRVSRTTGSYSYSLFKLNVCECVPVFVGTHANSVCAVVQMWRSEDSFWESALSFHHGFKLGLSGLRKGIPPPSHPADPIGKALRNLHNIFCSGGLIAFPTTPCDNELLAPSLHLATSSSYYPLTSTAPFPLP